MSESDDEAQYNATRSRELDLYIATMFLMIIGIAILIAYSLRLGSLVGPGVEQSFGLALAGMFLMGAVLFHILDRTYRVWPLGRKVAAKAPGPVTEQGAATFLRWVIVLAAAAAIAYVLGVLIGAW